MPMDSALIEKLIREGIPGAKVRIQDLVGDSDHYAVQVESKAFQGKSRVQQHQMVYAALQGRLGPELHALSVQTVVPKEEG